MQKDPHYYMLLHAVQLLFGYECTLNVLSSHPPPPHLPLMYSGRGTIPNMRVITFISLLLCLANCKSKHALVFRVGS